MEDVVVFTRIYIYLREKLIREVASRIKTAFFSV